MRSILVRLAAMAIAALHAGFLWQRIDDLSITEPEVLARWGAAAIAAAAGLLLRHLRVSWRSWVVFWTVIVLLHAAAPAQPGRLDVFIEAVFALAPLILLSIGFRPATHLEKTPLAGRERFTLPIALLATSVPCRAPPCW